MKRRTLFCSASDDTNEYGYVTIEGFVKRIVKKEPNITRMFMAQAIESTAKQMRCKDNKLYTANWEACWMKNPRAKAGHSICNYLSITKLKEMLVDPKNLREYIIADSFAASVYATADAMKSQTPNAKEDESTGLLFLEVPTEPKCEAVMRTVLPSPEDLVTICHSEIGTSYSISETLIKYVRARPVDYPNIGSDFEDNLMHISDTQGELKFKRKYWYADAISIYAMHNKTAPDFKEFVAKSNERMREDFKQCDSGNGRIVNLKTRADMAKLAKLIEDLKLMGNIHLLVGSPGTGKTKRGIDIAGEKSVVFSLCNTVAFNAAKRARTQGFECEPMSFTKMRILNMCRALGERVNDRAIMIDEMSQLGAKDVDILISAAEMCLVNNKPLVLMGDEYQIPSFLSRGSLLYSIMDQFPEIVTRLSKNWRVEPGAVAIVNAMDKFKASGDTRDFESFRFPGSIMTAMTAPNPDRVFITGAVTQATLINKYIYNQVMPELNLDINTPTSFCEELNVYKEDDRNAQRQRTFMEYLSREPLQFIATDTETLPIGNGAKLKIMQNERFLVYGEPGKREVTVKSIVDEDKKATIELKTFLKFFEPAEAINVNKAQGLEWDHVILCYGDVFPRTEGVKGNSQIRTKFEHFYVGCTRAKKSLHIYFGNYGHEHLTPVTKFNIFKEL